MPRFAVLQHDRPPLHWDVFLEQDGVLRSWRLAAPPQAGAVVDAEPALDHRLAYLEYEGPVSGGRGSVTRWDGGTFEWKAQEADRVVVYLAGYRLRGVFQLERCAAGAWRGCFTADSE
ncbi:MAG TPA: DNA polymerase ligase N-terminal domain-containing protein [Gemmataceae bacterium]|nr:DNA polymerase ligase N-terminal domain-containing protein [Gemmataceae bacterium]